MHILLIEKDDGAARILELGLRKAAPATLVSRDADVPNATRDYRAIDAVLINHNLNDDTFSRCFLLSKYNPALRIIVISSPGESLRHFQQLREHTGIIHEIVEKPVYFPKVAQVLESIDRRKLESQSRPSARLQRHLPAGVSIDDLHSADTGDAMLAEKAVLFVDIRRSTEILRKHKLDDFFAKLNRYLEHLSGIVERNKGEVIKYTGDGMLVLFGGFARRYLGFRCACELLAAPQADADFRIGLGLTDGLVMLGFIGTESRLFYDVIGSNVNIAARFCADAAAGELMMSDEVMRASGLETTLVKSQQLNVKGLDAPVYCHRYKPGVHPQ